MILRRLPYLPRFISRFVVSFVVSSFIPTTSLSLLLHHLISFVSSLPSSLLPLPLVSPSFVLVFPHLLNHRHDRSYLFVGIYPA